MALLYRIRISCSRILTLGLTVELIVGFDRTLIRAFELLALRVETPRAKLEILLKQGRSPLAKEVSVNISLNPQTAISDNLMNYLYKRSTGSALAQF